MESPVLSKQLELSELKQIIKNRFSFDRRKVIFFTLNSCLLGLAVFSLFSAITLESNSQIFRIRTYLTDINLSNREQARKLETILIPQNIAQLCTIVASIIGYYGIYQKSQKILHLFPISLGISLAFRTIATIVIISYFNTIKSVFEEEVGTFITLQILFLAFNWLFCVFAYQQFKKAQVEYHIVTKDRERLIMDNNMAYELIKKIIKN
ncbi:unnamed protein product (macronuclear) [Paramecium tetraurelia]|uniref:Uncharacterized protein n=2 Tax=Paramecium TaxID=5884 RepID=A0CSL9_PARTE|nr:uncharacterized protein GSPATT00010058001 [Paramecium tetraurelia]CAD8165141.1 unnamed protein product [Paramecium octaurelia]CAK73786.1 unnamed protein product [Paramecium tetraurelia]|eukprot:XP_001441183.1 hypothetical protein (macronuclear) [Paramecium tetraurelia strain d4-2]